MGQVVHTPDLWSVIGGENQIGAVILEGRLYRVLRNRASFREPNFALFLGFRYGMEPAGRVERVLNQGLEDLCPSQQVKPSKAEAALKDRLWLHERLRFVVNRLIPVLRDLASGSAVDHTEGLEPMGSLEGLEEQILTRASMGEELARSMLGENMILVRHPIWGNYRKPADVKSRPCFLRADGEAISLKDVPVQSLDALDQAFREKFQDRLGWVSEKAVRKDLRALEADLERVFEARVKNVLYRDPERRVVMFQNGRVAVVQNVPSFVAEAPDGSLRLFDRVWVWLEICSLEPEVVLGSSPRVFTNYDHHFVNVGRLCTGSDYEVLEAFQQMPLEKGIVAYLNHARLVLCAGYYEDSDAIPYDEEAIYRRPAVEQGDAQSQALPIYRYYRSKGA